MTAVAADRTFAVRASEAASATRRHRYLLWSLLTLTALLYLAGLSRNGWANDFYAAAVQAGTRSWKAFFFGSFDASNFITVDKTPASLWVMELSARLFGLNSWSMLVPQALEGVASVALLYAAVRRWHGPRAGLLAGLTLAITPVAALMFRYNNPDALLVLLMTAAAYAVVRAVESGRTRWLVLAGALLGFGFLAKMLQAFLILPPLGLVYLAAGPRRWPVRIAQLAAGLGAVLVSAGWWVAAVMLTPAADRPYVGGSTDNSILQLAIGYNGLGRIDGDETGSVGFSGGRGGGSAFGGATGIGRLLAADMGGQISWLLPAALIALAALLWLSWRGRHLGWLPSARGGQGAGSVAGGGAAGGPGGPQDAGDGTRAGTGAAGPPRDLAAALLWGGWLVVTGLVFSFMAGIIHPYYTVALAPAIGALAGIGAVRLWQAARVSPAARYWLAAGVASSAIWSFVLLTRSASWLPPLRYAILAAGLVAVAALALAPRLGAAAGSLARQRALAATVAAAALFAALAGPAAYSLDTIAVSHAGALPSARPGGDLLGRRAWRHGRGSRHRRRPHGPGHRHARRPVWLHAPVVRPRRLRAGRSRQRKCRGRQPGIRRRLSRTRPPRRDRSSRHRHWNQGRRPRRHGRRARRRPERLHDGELRADTPASDRRQPLHLGRRYGELGRRGPASARDRRPGHVDRRIQRHRPGSEPGPVRALRR